MPVIKSWENGGRSSTAAREHIARLNASLADQAAIISGLNSKVNHHQEVARLAGENSRLCDDMLKKSADREGVLTKQVDDQRETINSLKQKLLEANLQLATEQGYIARRIEEDDQRAPRVVVEPEVTATPRQAQRGYHPHRERFGDGNDSRVVTATDGTAREHRRRIPWHWVTL